MYSKQIVRESLVKSAGNGASTLALKPMGRVIQSLKETPVAPQNIDLPEQKHFKENFKIRSK